MPPATTPVPLAKARTGRIRRASLDRMLQELFVRISETVRDPEILLHIPLATGRLFPVVIDNDTPANPTSLYLLGRLASAPEQFSCRSVAALPRRHPLRSELMVLAASPDLIFFLTGRLVRPATLEPTESEMWEISITLEAPSVAAAMALLSGGLAPNAAGAKWLRDKTARLSQAAGTPAGHPPWLEVLTNLIFDLDAEYLGDRDEIRRLQTLTAVQNAVGWQLSTGDLFAAMTDILKQAIGYHYLEVELLEQHGKDYEVSAVHHRNETGYGGPTLTIILKPQAQADIARAHRAVILTPEEASALMMNPRLMGFMGFQSGLLVPLVHHRKPNGLLKLFSTEAGYYQSVDQTLIDSIADVLARAVENVKAHAMFRRMATIDGLTNIHNRRYFMEQLSREFKRARRYHNHLSLIMLDIDRFKIYNDTYGHLRGDRVLSTIGAILKACVREVDLVARYGGEEFTILLPEANLDQGSVVAEKIRAAVAEHDFRLADRHSAHANVTVSVGITTLGADVQSASDLVNRADMALYRAKRDGRNRCVNYQ